VVAVAVAVQISFQLIDVGMDTVLEAKSPIVGDENIQTCEFVPGFFRIVHGVVLPDECAEIIRQAENKGFTKAALYTNALGEDHYSDIRKSQRCIIDSVGFSERLWERIKHLVPAVWKHGECVVGLNERLRILKYLPGDEFQMHADGSYTTANGDNSKITVLLYLNKGYRGGFTHYWSTEGLVSVEPYIGSIVLQDQILDHCVPPLEEGVKYALRTEVMYRPVPYKSDSKSFKDIVVYE
jgi:hypothetical protein